MMPPSDSEEEEEEGKVSDAEEDQRPRVVMIQVGRPDRQRLAQLRQMTRGLATQQQLFPTCRRILRLAKCPQTLRKVR